MKIGVESSAVFRRGKTGVGWYAFHLITALSKAMPDDELYLCYISFLTKQPERLKPSPDNVVYRRISIFPGKIYNFLDHYLIPLPIDLLARARTDVFFFPNYFRWPLVFTKKSVVAIHDLAFAEAPQFLVPRHQKYMSRRVPASARKASHIVAVSQHTKDQLVKRYGINQGRITVVTPALDLELFKPADSSAIAKAKQKAGITKKYLLFFGTTDPRKNVDGIVKAFGLLPRHIQAEYQLVLGGAPGRDWGWGWYDEEIDALEKGLPKGSLIRTGYFNEADKPALMSGADLFLWPSHYEGWGMPILEAQACGTPVITARNSSLPEAGGDAAAYVENNSPETIAALIQELLGDAERRKTMRETGFRHVQQFTWEHSAEVLAGVLRTVGSQGTRKASRSG